MIMTPAALLAALALTQASPAGDPAPLPAGPHAAGFRVETIERAPQPLELHVWYPAAACDTAARLTLGLYIDTERGSGDPAQETIRETPMRACRDAAPLDDAHPVLVGRHNGGTWALQGEYLASHGYIVAMVASRGSRVSGTPEERAKLVAAQYERMAEEMDAALTHVVSRGGGDGARVGVLGAGVAPMLFAMRSDRPRAVSMQDSGVFSGGFTADVLRHTPSWQPARMPARLLYVPSIAHDDLATSGYLLRRRAGSEDPRQRAFGDVLSAQRTFFDTYVKGHAR